MGDHAEVQALGVRFHPIGFNRRRVRGFHPVRAQDVRSFCGVMGFVMKASMPAARRGLHGPRRTRAPSSQRSPRMLAAPGFAAAESARDLHSAQPRQVAIEEYGVEIAAT